MTFSSTAPACSPPLAAVSLPGGSTLWAPSCSRASSQFSGCALHTPSFNCSLASRPTRKCSSGSHIYVCSPPPQTPLIPHTFINANPNPPKAMTHSPLILALDTVRAYHSGPRIIVEVDVVMAPLETLRAAHDVAEALQVKLESLPDVERAYVHVDYETSHKPEHGLKKVL